MSGERRDTKIDLDAGALEIVFRAALLSSPMSLFFSCFCLVSNEGRSAFSLSKFSALFLVLLEGFFWVGPFFKTLEKVRVLTVLELGTLEGPASSKFKFEPELIAIDDGKHRSTLTSI